MLATAADGVGPLERETGSWFIRPTELVLCEDHANLTLPLRSAPEGGTSGNDTRANLTEGVVASGDHATLDAVQGLSASYRWAIGLCYLTPRRQPFDILEMSLSAQE